MTTNCGVSVSNRLIQRLSWDDLDPAFLQHLITLARDEDLSGVGLRKKPRLTGDRSTAALATTPRSARAAVTARVPLIPCGLPLLPLILDTYGQGCSAQLIATDAHAVNAGSTLAILEGDPRILLAAERVLLNFLQKLSGIATQTQVHVKALNSTHTRLLDIRKTTPGYRVLEKYAVACGGAWNHRLGLFDRVMLKDNHLALLGSSDDLARAVGRARQAAPDLPVEVEVDRIDQIPPVLSAGADVILLDNFSIDQIKQALALIGGRAFTEASGGITLQTLPDYGQLGLDFVSTGALVHQSIWVDIGLDWSNT